MNTKAHPTDTAVGVSVSDDRSDSHPYCTPMFAKITTGSLAAGLINYMDNVKEKDARILIAKGLCTASHEAICASFEI